MKEWFYSVTQTMVEELHLQGTELAVFAVINGFSQGGNGCFYGTRKTLTARCGMNSPVTIDTALKSLINKGLVERFSATIKGEEKICYAVSSQYLQDVQKLYEEYSKIEQGGIQNLNRGGVQNLSIENKVSENKTINQREKEKHFVRPSLEEVSAYCLERQNCVDAVAFFDFYESKGWKVGREAMKDWKAAVRTWERRERQERKNPTPSPLPRKKVAEPMDYDFSKDY